MGNELAPADVVESAISTTPDDPVDEISSLACDLARGYADFVETYRKAWGISSAEADAQLRQSPPADIRITRQWSGLIRCRGGVCRV